MGLWRDIFGPGKAEIWSEFASEMGAEYEPGGWFKTARIDWLYKDWYITLDTYAQSHGKSSTTYTRIRAPLAFQPPFNFSIVNRGFFSGLGDLFGMQRIRTGQPAIDENFIIKGEPVEGVKEFFEDADIAGQIAVQKDLELSIRHNSGGIFSGAPSDDLYYHRVGVIKDPIVLKQLFALFALSLDRIQALSQPE